MSAPLPAIPVIDVRDGGPLQHVQQCAAEARALRDACLGFFPRAALPLIPALDLAARRWLAQSRSPYVREIAEIATALEFSGVWLLNASYQWGCTARAFEQDGECWLARTLDWPFSGLGRHVAVARMSGAGGDFYSVTWPGYVGVLTAMAPQRFAACVNQAPMWRRTSHRWLRAFDFVANALKTWAERDSMPPDQLLRQTFEQSENYRAARRMLELTPVSRPVIYTLAGAAPGECCVIERTETGFVTREENTSAANDWLPARPRWEGRIGMRRFLTSTFADAAQASCARREALANWQGDLTGGGFDWVREPVLNPYTRLAVAACAARGILRTVGYDLGGTALPQPVTRVAELQAPAEAA